MQLSIIILNYKQKDFCHKCLTALFKHPPSCSFEVIVIDNASHDNSVNILKKAWGDKIRVIQNKMNEGYGEGHNIAIKKAKGEYIVIMNPDIEVQKNTIDLLYTYIKNHPKCGIAGPQLIYPDGSIQDSYRTFPKIWDLIIKRTFLRKLFTKRMDSYLMQNKNPNITRPVDWIVGAFLIIKKELFDSVKGFDKHFFLFMEDTDLCKRIWKSNHEVIYFPKAKARHHHARLSGGKLYKVIFKKTFYYHIASAFKYFWKWKKESF